MRAVIDCTAIDMTRPSLTHINIEWESRSANFIATDAFRLGFFKAEVSTTTRAPKSLLVPRKVALIADSLAKRSGEHVHFDNGVDASSWAGNTTHVYDETKRIWWINQSGIHYPDWRPVMPPKEKVMQTIRLEWAEVNRCLITCRALEGDSRRAEFTFLSLIHI